MRRLRRRLWSDLTVVNVALTVTEFRAPVHRCSDVAVEMVSSAGSQLDALVAVATGDDALLLRRLLRRRQETGLTLVLARHHGRVVGVCAAVTPLASDASPDVARGRPGRGEAVLGGLYCVPDVRGQGVGRLLVEAAVEVGVRAGAARLVALVDDDNVASLRTFAGVGFRPVSRTRTWFRFNRRRDTVERVESAAAACSVGRAVELCA